MGWHCWYSGWRHYWLAATGRVGGGEEGRKTSNGFEHFSAVWSVDRHLGRGELGLDPPSGWVLKKDETHTRTLKPFGVSRKFKVFVVSVPSCVCLFVILVCPTNYWYLELANSSLMPRSENDWWLMSLFFVSIFLSFLTGECHTN